MLEEFLVLLAYPVLVVHDEPGLLHQLAVGVAHTQPQPGHPVKQRTKLSRLGEVRKGFADHFLAESNLRTEV